MTGKAVHAASSPDAFRKGMRCLAAGVSVIASAVGDELAGLTATAVCSVTADPPRLLVCVNQSAGAHDIITRAGALSVNVLKCDSEEIARRFAGMVDGIRGHDRFYGSPWSDGQLGVPVLRDALAVFECVIIEARQLGTHTMFLCDVNTATAGPSDSEPLIYFDGAFCGSRAIQPPPQDMLTTATE